MKDGHGSGPLVPAFIIALCLLGATGMIVVGEETVREETRVLVYAVAACMVIATTGVVVALIVRYWRMPARIEHTVERHTVTEHTIDGRQTQPDIRVLNVPQVPGMGLNVWPTLTQGMLQGGQPRPAEGEDLRPPANDRW